MPQKLFWDIEGRKCDFTGKRCLKSKSLFSENSKQVICKMKNVQAHEIGGLALQKKNIKKIVLTMRTTGTLIFVDLK